MKSLKSLILVSTIAMIAQPLFAKTITCTLKISHAADSIAALKGEKIVFELGKGVSESQVVVRDEKSGSAVVASLMQPLNKPNLAQVVLRHYPTDNSPMTDITESTILLISEGKVAANKELKAIVGPKVNPIAEYLGLHTGANLLNDQVAQYFTVSANESLRKIGIPKTAVIQSVMGIEKADRLISENKQAFNEYEVLTLGLDGYCLAE